jgi:protein phosphatase
MPIKLLADALTDPGRVREKNEDTVFQKVFAAPGQDPVGLFIVADGVGGRLAGQAASYWAVETIKNSLSDVIRHHDPRATNQFSQETILELQAASTVGLDPGSMEDRLMAAVKKANSVVREYARSRPEEAYSAGSTIIAALVHGLQAFVANVGDSRGYLLRDGRLRQITTDHSVVQRLVDSGRLQPDQVFTHPQRHLIYRSLGAQDSLEVDIFPVELEPNDVLLLCTDGLWEMVRDDAKMAGIIRESPSVQHACQTLVEAANASGGADNIGVVLVGVYA